MPSRIFAAFVFLAGLLTPVSGLAQDGAGVVLRFVSFPPVKKPATVDLLLGEGKTLEVEIPSNELSAPYKVPRLGTWAVGKSGVGGDGKSAFKTYGKTKALSSSRQLLLLVRKGASNAEGFKVIPFDNRAARFGAGKFLFLNAAEIDLAGELGGEKFALKPGAHTIIQPRPDQGTKLSHATFYFRKNEAWKPFFSSNWPLNDKARGLIFFYNDPRSSRLKFHSIRDFL